ncbi:MAG: DUF58 domain-containing protein [Luminiphilus sp.]|nr:DUF58 domain-containing protein [Luminiphilus sp.]
MLFQANPKERLKNVLLQRYRRWLGRRLPAARTITLEQRRLFIFPSRQGFLFAVTLLLMLLTAINYQNNLAYGLTFWLAMLFIVAVHFTHANLLKMVISSIRVKSVYPGQQAEFVFRISCTSARRGHHAVKLVWPDSEVLVDVPAGGEVEVSLRHKVVARGWFDPPKLRIESTYPLGLLRCWSFAYFDSRALVWPRPLEVDRRVSPYTENASYGFSEHEGLDDLMGFRDYRIGDAPRLIDWRSHARGLPLQTKLYSLPVDEDHWLDWHDFSAGSVEQKLSWLCWLVLQHHRRGESFGLRLPSFELPLAAGDRQRDLALRALALHGLSRGEVG